MKKIQMLVAATLLFTLTSCETLKMVTMTGVESFDGLSTDKIIAGLKQALTVGADNAVSQLSMEGGFTQNKFHRIGVPDKLTPVTDTMKKIGLGFMVNDFEAKMNLAAEQATSSAAPVFVNAISEMKFKDARAILDGDDTAATDYLKKKTYTKLLELYKPIVKRNMAEVGVTKVYNSLMEKYDAIPFKSKPAFSLDSYITEQALNGMFATLAGEEKKIRKNPAARTTELLRQVFGK